MTPRRVVGVPANECFTTYGAAAGGIDLRLEHQEELILFNGMVKVALDNDVLKGGPIHVVRVGVILSPALCPLPFVLHHTCPHRHGASTWYNFHCTLSFDIICHLYSTDRQKKRLLILTC